MHLRFTDKELATLVEMVSLATSVAMWNRKPGAEEGLAAFEGMEQKILEKVKHAGQGSLIEFDEEKQVHQVSLEYQESSFFQECYDEFRNECFWEELVIRLADRDLARVIGKSAWENLTEEQRRERTEKIEKRYWEELTTNGIDRVAVIFPPGEG
ncbi:hypothetical protein [Haloferula sp.]|uniref:hypothetical protein n=1 Tax=Haloferula sp. TaxID=2497595 RepID=UPI003C715277